MNYILAIMFHQGHAEAQIIDPATGACWLGIDFHGTTPKTPKHFDGQGAMLIPISRTSATALRDMMDQLKLFSGMHRRVDLWKEGDKGHPKDAFISDDLAPQQADIVDDVLSDLEKLMAQFPECKPQMMMLFRTVVDQIDRADKDKYRTLFDDAQALPDMLRALADEVRAQSPELAARLMEGEHSVLGRYRFFATPYYFVDGADPQGSRMKYERQHQYAQDFVGNEIDVYPPPRTYQRATEAMPLIGTNCLNFLLRAGRDVAGIPFTKIAPELYDAHNVTTLERIIEERVMGPGHEIENGMDVRVERLEGGTPVAYINIPGACGRFPECLKDMTHGGKPLLQQLGATHAPLLDRSVSHAAMRR